MQHTYVQFVFSTADNGRPMISCKGNTRILTNVWGEMRGTRLRRLLASVKFASRCLGRKFRLWEQHMAQKDKYGSSVSQNTKRDLFMELDCQSHLLGSKGAM